MTIDDLRNQLKPCPFCGRKVYIASLDMESNIGATKMEIECECGIGFEIYADDVIYSADGTPHQMGLTALDKWEKRSEYMRGRNDALVTVQGEWIPCSDRLPEDIRPVLVTWKNTDPSPYYQSITGKHFIGAAHYHRGKWYWYSSVTEDLLAEYGECESEEFDEAIKVVAWMPLPEPWKGADDEID